MPKAGHHRFEPLFHFVLAGRRNGRQGPPVERVEGGENFEPAFFMSEFPGQFEQAFVGFGPAVAEKDLAGRDQVDERLSQAALGFVVVQVGDVHQLARLLHEGIGDGGMGVAQGRDGNAPAEIEVALAGDIEDIAAAAARQSEVKAGVAWDDVLLVKALNIRRLIAQDGRWRGWNDFFHAKI